MKLTGVFAPVPTPFFDDGTIDVEGWRGNLRIWSSSPLDGIVICGSNGELPFMKLSERAILTKIAAEECKGRLSLMTGAHFPSTGETIECACEAAKAGAQNVLVLPPHYFKNGMSAVTKYFEDVADASPIPVFIYNMPANTGVDIDTDTMIRLLQHPNIRGVKDTSGSMTKIGYMAAAADKDTSVFGGTGSWFLAALAMGACGGTMAASILYPETCQKIYRLFKENKMDEAVKLQAKLLPVSDAVTVKYGVPGLKAALESRGMTGGTCRASLMPLPEKAKHEIIKTLDESGLDKFESWRG